MASPVTATATGRVGALQAAPLLSSGTITVRRPRVRDSEERFESRVLPVFARKSKKLAELIPELYHSGLSPSGRSLHGLAEGDFDPSASSGQALALRGLWGDDAPVSASTVARLEEKWQAGVAEREEGALGGPGG